MQWTPFSNFPNPMLAPASSTSPRRPSLETTEPESLQTPKILFRLRIIPSFFFCGIASPRMDDDPLKAAVRGNRVEEVKALLRDDPSIDINLGRGLNEWNPLQLASFKGYHKVVTVLLAHPGIDVNLKDTVGSTPLSLSCSNGKVAVVAVLLRILVLMPFWKIGLGTRHYGGPHIMEPAASWNGSSPVAETWERTGRERLVMAKVTPPWRLQRKISTLRQSYC